MACEVWKLGKKCWVKLLKRSKKVNVVKYCICVCIYNTKYLKGKTPGVYLGFVPAGKRKTIFTNYKNLHENNIQS